MASSRTPECAELCYMYPYDGIYMIDAKATLILLAYYPKGPNREGICCTCEVTFRKVKSFCTLHPRTPS